jgi:hypothetical protein
MKTDLPDFNVIVYVSVVLSDFNHSIQCFCTQLCTDETSTAHHYIRAASVICLVYTTGALVYTSTFAFTSPPTMDTPSTSRKFIDLILKASAKWANWNPPYEIKVRVSVNYLLDI